MYKGIILGTIGYVHCALVSIFCMYGLWMNKSGKYDIVYLNVLYLIILQWLVVDDCPISVVYKIIKKSEKPGSEDIIDTCGSFQPLFKILYTSIIIVTTFYMFYLLNIQKEGFVFVFLLFIYQIVTRKDNPKHFSFLLLKELLLLSTLQMYTLTLKHSATFSSKS
jgi:hypothetical protein